MTFYRVSKQNLNNMGKGDSKTRRGKIILGTYGVRRRRKKTSRQSVMKVKPAKVKEAREKRPSREKKTVTEVVENDKMQEAGITDVPQPVTDAGDNAGKGEEKVARQVKKAALSEEKTISKAEKPEKTKKETKSATEKKTGKEAKTTGSAKSKK